MRRESLVFYSSDELNAMEDVAVFIMDRFANDLATMLINPLTTQSLLFVFR